MYRMSVPPRRRHAAAVAELFMSVTAEFLIVCRHRLFSFSNGPADAVLSISAWPFAPEVAPVARGSSLAATDRAVHERNRQPPEHAAQVEPSIRHVVRHIVLPRLRLDLSCRRLLPASVSVICPQKLREAGYRRRGNIDETKIYTSRAARKYFLPMVRPSLGPLLHAQVPESPDPMPPGPRLAAITWAAREGGKQDPHENSNPLYLRFVAVITLVHAICTSSAVLLAPVRDDASSDAAMRSRRYSGTFCATSPPRMTPPGSISRVTGALHAV